MPAAPTARCPARRWSRYAQRCETGCASATTPCLHAERHRRWGSTLLPPSQGGGLVVSPRSTERKAPIQHLSYVVRKEPLSMKHTSTTQRTLDLVIGKRIFTTCWLGASLGISIVQMRLLAQAWLVLPHALAPACLMSAWILGSLFGMRVPGAPRVWGSSALACILLWLIGPSLVTWHLSRGMVLPALVSMASLASAIGPARTALALVVVLLARTLPGLQGVSAAQPDRQWRCSDPGRCLGSGADAFRGQPWRDAYPRQADLAAGWAARDPGTGY